MILYLLFLRCLSIKKKWNPLWLPWPQMTRSWRRRRRHLEKTLPVPKLLIPRHLSCPPLEGEKKNLPKSCIYFDISSHPNWAFSHKLNRSILFNQNKFTGWQQAACSAAGSLVCHVFLFQNTDLSFKTLVPPPPSSPAVGTTLHTQGTICAAVEEGRGRNRVPARPILLVASEAQAPCGTAAPISIQGDF